jgi:predicted porin
MYGVMDAYLGSLDNKGVQNAAGAFVAPTLTCTAGTCVLATPVAPAAAANNFQQTQTVLNAGGLSGSRFGLRGSEDLGGGLTGNFVIETGLDHTSPGATILGNRQTFAGLGGGFGEVRLGRQYTAYDELRGGSDLFGHSTFSTTAAFGSWQGFGRDYTYRANNAIHYISPNFGGVTAALTYGMGENKTATASAGKIVALRLQYANGPLMVGFANQNEKYAVSGQFDGATAFGIRNIAVTQNPAPGTTSETHTLLAGSYDFGAAKLQAGYNIGKDDSDVPKEKEFVINAAVPMGATTLVVGYSQSKIEDAKSKTFALQALYALSKRTNLYAGLVSSKDDWSAVNLTAKRQLTAVGVRHTF